MTEKNHTGAVAQGVPEPVDLAAELAAKRARIRAAFGCISEDCDTLRMAQDYIKLLEGVLASSRATEPGSWLDWATARMEGAAQPPAAPVETVTDGSIQEGDVLSYTMTDGVGKVTGHVRPVQRSSAGSALEERVVDAITEWVGETPPEHALAAAREAIAIVRDEPQTAVWKPIKTAPKDGTKVLLRFEGPFNDRAEDGITTGQYLSGGWWLSCIWASSTAHKEPAAWAPISSPVTRPK